MKDAGLCRTACIRYLLTSTDFFFQPQITDGENCTAGYLTCGRLNCHMKWAECAGRRNWSFLSTGSIRFGCICMDHHGMLGAHYMNSTEGVSLEDPANSG